jgi:hypothetical protein
MAKRRAVKVMMISLGVVACAPAAWWSSGAFPEEVDPEGADYLMRPPTIGLLWRIVLGIVAWALALSAAVSLRRLVAGGLDRRWQQVVAAAALSAAYVGVAYRVASSPVIGANIGGAMLILGAVPFGAGTSTWAIVALWDIRRANSSQRTACADPHATR